MADKRVKQQDKAPEKSPLSSSLKEPLQNALKEFDRLAG
jgi:hypothetical protein